MLRKKCFATLGVLRRKVLGYGRLGVALTILIATLTLVRGAVGFQFDSEPDKTGAYNILHLFTWAKNPQGNLTFDAAGNLYGTTEDGGSAKCDGCGAVWKLARNAKGAWTVTILHAFTGVDGANPLAGLIFDLAGNLYGTTAGGGDLGCHKPYGCGVVFKLAPKPDGTWTESVLHSFTGADGWEPDAGLIVDATGNLYGETLFGGADDSGVAFKLAPSADGTWTESVLHSFTGGADGDGPGAGLILDVTGNLYGTTYYGGSDVHGVVFKLKPNPDGTWTESVLHSFTGADGSEPQAGLTLDAAGDLYGTTTFGGACAFSPSGCGVVFKLAPNADGAWTESALYSFTGGADGTYPRAGLIFDAAGNLYGTTLFGGDSTACGFGCGVVFKLLPSSSGWSETVLHTFIGFGSYPLGGVIFDRVGNL
jgi:uncharacterized repeat protein (TIGR03803 family)